MKIFTRLIILAFALSPSFYSCVQHDIPAIQCNQPDIVVSYENDIHKDIVVTICAQSGCHNGDNGEERNWLEFDKFQAHAPDVRHRVTLPAEHPDHMPRKGVLTPDQIQDIVCWVDQGAQDN